MIMISNSSNGHKKIISDKLLSNNIFHLHDIWDLTTADSFHYTSPEGLKGILETRTFHFTDSQFLNDYHEKLNINDELETFWKNNRAKYDKNFASLLKDIRVEKYEDTGFSFLDTGKMNTCRYFVFSMSEKSDSLTMWKYYAKRKDYEGYCITIFPLPVYSGE